MRRRDFIKGISGAAVDWRARSLMSAAVLQAPAQLIPVSPTAAQSGAIQPIEIVPQVGHTDIIESAVFSPNGRTIISCSRDSTLKLWDVESGRELRTFVGHSNSVNTVRFSPDGRNVLSGGGDRTLKLWDVLSGRELSTFTGHRDFVFTVAFSPNGRTIASGSQDKTLKLWDVATGRELRSVNEQGSIYTVRFSPDGHTLASLSGDTLKLREVSSGRVLHILTGVSGVAFSQDGRSLYSSHHNRTLKFWDVANWRELRTIYNIDVYAISPDGRTIVLSGENTGSAQNVTSLTLWDVSSDRQLHTLAGAGSVIAFSPDGQFLLSKANYKTLKVWDVSSGLELRTLTGFGNSVRAATVSLDGRTIASASDDNSITAWAAPSGRVLHTLTGHSDWVHSLAFSPDGRIIVSGSFDKTLKLWDVASGHELSTLKGHDAPVHAVAFSPNGQTICSGSGTQLTDGTMKLWDAATGRELRTWSLPRNWVSAIAFSPNGRTVISGTKSSFTGIAIGADGRIISIGRDATLKLWDAESGRELRALPYSANIDALAFSPNGRTFVSASGKDLKLWDVESGRELHTFTGSDAWIWTVAFSPDGRTIVTGNSDKTLTRWDTASGLKQRSITGHLRSVEGVAFSPDGKKIISASIDGTVRSWSSSGELLATSIASSTGIWLTITPEGFFDSSDNAAGLLSAIRGFEVHSIDQFYQQLYRPDVVRQKLSFDSGRVKYAADKANLVTILASKSPPVIIIVSPQDKSEIGKDSVTVEVKLTYRDVNNIGGIGRVEWRVNGVTRAVEDLQQAADAGDRKVTRKLALPPGDNVVELVAYNKANLAASLPARVSVTVNSAAPQPQPKLHVLALAIDKYPGIPPVCGPDRMSTCDLNFSVADAKSMLAAFELSKSDKTIYADVIGYRLFNEQVTAQNVRAELKRLGGIIRPEDVFVLYLAGHGVTLDGRFYFVPHDTKGTLADFKVETAIGQSQLQDWLTEIPAFRSVLIYDSCESGSATEDRSGFRGLQQLVAAEKLSRSMGRTVLSATTDVAVALEGYRSHGVFTYVLLDAFAKAEPDKDGHITTEALAAYLQKNLPALTESLSQDRQEPQVKLAGAPFGLVPRIDIAEINRVR